MSGFQDEFKDPQDFEDKYGDFFELGQDELYIKLKNMKMDALEKKQKKVYERRVASKEIQRRSR